MSFDNPASLFGLPRDYVFMLLGGLVGFSLGLLAGKLRGNRVRRVAGGGAGAPAAPAPRAAEPPAAPPGVNLVVNGKNLDIEPGAMAEIQRLIQAGQKIDAIKTLRDATGLGLAEAKAVVESLEKVIR